VKRVSSVLASLVILVALLAPAAQAAPGDLDPSFGTDGSVRFLPSNEDIALRGVAVQPDGKIVLTGGDQTTNSILVVRLLENGSFDPSFGSGGVVSTPFPAGSFGEGRDVAIQPDGKIVVAGIAKGPSTVISPPSATKRTARPIPPSAAATGSKSSRSEPTRIGRKRWRSTPTNGFCSPAKRGCR